MRHGQLPDLAGRHLGGGVVAANDELFAERENLIKPSAPTFSPRTFGHRGQVYDGWETRRRREPGHDWAIVRLGAPGIIREVEVDTSFFVGNYPPEISVEGAGIDGYPSATEVQAANWLPLVPRSPAAGDIRNRYPVTVPDRMTHIRLCLYPDGGVARLRAYGEVVPDPRLLAAGEIDLAALENGGAVAGCSNMFYSSPANLISPGLASTMGDGWETARRRDGGHDWVEVTLAAPGVVRLAELDTTHFVGNAPGQATLSGRDARRTPPDGSERWRELLPRSRLQPDTRHRFLLTGDQPEITQARLDVFPDGGMARLRLFGRPTPEGWSGLALRWFNRLPYHQAVAVLHEYGLSTTGAAAVLGNRPLGSISDLPVPLRASLAEPDR